MTMTINECNDVVRTAICNCDRYEHDYFMNCLKQRLANGAGSVTYFENELDLADALMKANWNEFHHEAIAEGCKAFMTRDVRGQVGMVPLKDLPKDKPCILIDPKKTGMLSLATITKRPFNADYTVLIIGNENGHEIMFTFHPGNPLPPSTLKNGDNKFGYSVGTILTVQEAMDAGFKHVKVVSDYKDLL